MSFIHEQPLEDLETKMKNPGKRNKRKIFFIVLSIIIVTVFSFGAYLVASGSKIFEGGLSGSTIIKSLIGQDQLKGEEKNRVNILILGMGGPNHPGGLLADSIIFASLDTLNNKIALLSIPRDLIVPIPAHNQDKINSAFSTGYSEYYQKNCSSKKNKDACRNDALAAGANLTGKTVSDILDQSVDYYLFVDFNGFEKVIDQLGGIDIYVDKSIYDPSYPDKMMIGYEPFSIKAGQRHLNGATALKYARSRETSSDFDRAARQQKIILAVKDKVLSVGILSNPKKLSDFVSTLSDSVRTNLSLSEAKTLFEKIRDVPSKSVKTVVLSNGSDGYLSSFNNGSYSLKPRTGNFKEIQELVADIFGEEKEKESAKIEVLNATSTVGVAADLAKEIEKMGYTIVNVNNAATKNESTIIYDYSHGKKPETIKYLKELTGGQILEKSSSVSGADISVILGSDYMTKSQQSSSSQ